MSILALAFASGLATQASAAFYLGGGDGIRIAFRTQGHSLVWANVFVRLNCKESLGGERHIRRHKDVYALPDSPLEIERDGTFSFISRPPIQEEDYSLDEALIGHVGPDFVKGRYEYSYGISFRDPWEHCQTNTFPFGPAEVPFRARRVR